jgi:lactate permease
MMPRVSKSSLSGTRASGLWNVKYLQVYDPAGNALVSTALAALPVVTLLYLLALHPTRSNRGSLHKGIAAHKAATIAALVALLVAIFAFRMPVKTAGMSFLFGAMWGLFPIGWIIVSAIFLYNITLVSGLFTVLHHSVASLSDDRRLQAILIAFSFGAFMEGAAGFGTPVAISGALLVGLGFKPLQAAILCLIANTAPVAYGGLGTPIIALSGVTGIDEMLISKMAARQLPFFSVIVPVWMTAVQVRMDGRPWRDVWAVWPALLVSGGSFAITQFVIGNYVNFQLVDILGGAVSMAATALFCRVWRPRTGYVMSDGGVREGKAEGPAGVEAAAEVAPRRRYTRAEVVKAWTPWVLLTGLVFLWGLPKVKKEINERPGAAVTWNVPAVHGVVYRTPPVVKKEMMDEAQFKFHWMSAAGTAIFIAALLSGVMARLSARQWGTAAYETVTRLRLPLLTICLILGMGFVTKYSGMDAVLGLAFTRTGWFYPFFSAMLGWLGVALTGSDTSSNIMFGSMQKITAEQLGLDPVLIVTSNSTGGVMGKMIDAQSIVVATAACYEDKEEGKMAAGPIFRGVLVHSIVLAMLMGVLVMLQAYVFPQMVPKAEPPAVAVERR